MTRTHRRLGASRPTRLAAWLIAAAVLALTGTTGVLGSATATAAVPADSSLSDVGSAVTIDHTMLDGTVATITVDKTQNLVSQVLNVSWNGFKKSNLSYSSDSTTYAVRLYECRGAAPASLAECYGSAFYTYPSETPTSTKTPDGPGNRLDTFTSRDGSGTAQWLAFTKSEAYTLGCSATSSCSLVVLPNYGDVHKQYRHAVFPYAPSSGFPEYDTVRANLDRQQWAWDNRITVPLRFAPSPGTCSVGAADFTTVGAPNAGVAINSWQPALCTASDSASVDYTDLPEVQARALVTSGQADVALTTLPVTSQPAGSPSLVYAPVTVSSIVVAFRVDDTVTGSQIKRMNLTPRLIAKLITQSYGGIGFAQPPNPVGAGNPATYGNALSLFTDPEFLSINDKKVSWGFGTDTPLYLAGSSDLTSELTRLLWDDPAARAFLEGQADPWGMKLNTSFATNSWPTDQFSLQDPFAAFTKVYNPLPALPIIARYLASSQPSGFDPNGVALPGGQISYPRLPQNDVGRRDLIAIMDGSWSSLIQSPVAAIRNAAGQYVSPSSDSMTVALSQMTKDSTTGTLSANYASGYTGLYPLTTVQYAVTGAWGTPLAKAKKIANFLTYAAGPGQVPGNQAGELPAGYLPLSSVLRAQTLAAAAVVAAQRAPTTQTPSPTPTLTPIPSATPNPTPSPTQTTPGYTPASGDGRLPGPFPSQTQNNQPARSGSGSSAAPTPSSSVRPSGSSSPSVRSEPTPRPSFVALVVPRVDDSGSPATGLIPLLLIVGLLAGLVGLAMTGVAASGGPGASVAKVGARFTRGGH